MKADLKIDLPVVFAISIVTVIYLFQFYDYGLNLLDEGYLVTCTMRVARGAVPYIDFQNNYAPGRYYFFASIIKVIGNNMLVFRGTWVALYALAAAIMYLLIFRLSGRGMAILVALSLPLFRCPWHKTFFVLLPLVCLLSFFSYIDNRTRPKLVLAGFVTALSMFIRQDVGVYAFLAFSCTLIFMQRECHDWRKTFRSLLAYSASFLISSSPIILYYIYRGSLFHMIEQFFFAGVRDVSASSTPFLSFRLIQHNAIFYNLLVSLFYFPLIIYMTGLAWVIHDIRSKYHDTLFYKILLVTVLSAMVYIQLLNRSDLAHLWQVWPPALLLMTMVVVRVRKERRSNASIVAISSFIAVLICYGVVYFSPSNPQSPPFARPKKEYVRLKFDRAPLVVDRGLADELYMLKNEVDSLTGQGEYILAVPDIPMIYYIFKRKNPLRYDLLRPGIADEVKLQKENVAVLQKTAVPCMILDEREIYDGIPERLFKNREKILYGYLMGRFVLKNRTPMFSVWENRMASANKYR